MDFGLTDEQRRFRAEVRAFLEDEQVRGEVDGLRGRPPRQEAGMLDVYRRLGERGWLAVNWPEEYGGLGRGLVEKSILTEELIFHGVPDLVHIVSVDIVGLILQTHGTAEQKKRYLPELARGEQSASILYSEPGVGSDLSSLRARARADGDGWRLYGRKIYSLKSHIADFALCAARTTESEVAFHGITLFIVPLKTPGVQVRLMENLSNDAFNDVTLDGIRLTRDDVVGEVDDGWQVINSVLPVERTGMEFQAKARRVLDATMRHATDNGRLDDAAHAQHLVELDARTRAAELLAWRAVSRLEAGDADDVTTATAKWYSTEQVKANARHSIEVLGLEGALSGWDAEAVEGGAIESAYRDAPGFTLSAGSSEIMQYLIANTGLGLLS